MSANYDRAVTAARNGELDPQAPVQASATLDIDAPADVVFATLADLASWPRFLPGVTRMRRHDTGPVTVGSRFSWRNAGFPLASTIQRAEPGVELTWTGRSLWIMGVHRNTFAPLPEDSCRFTSSESMAGVGISRLLPSAALREQLQRFAAAVGREAEGRARTGA